MENLNYAFYFYLSMEICLNLVLLKRGYSNAFIFEKSDILKECAKIFNMNLNVFIQL